MMDDASVDVVIIGGGVQGLVILDRLIDAGYACALVTDGDVGGGQTLHSHGFLNTGFGTAGDELARAAGEIVHPFLRNRGVELDDNWVVLPAPGVPPLANLPPTELPVGFSPVFISAARKLPDQSFKKRHLVEALVRDREDRIIRGTIIGFQGHNPVEAVQVQLQGSSTALELHARAVVIAAGCGSKRLLRDLVGATPQVELIKHRVVDMVCVRAPRGSLPGTSVAAMPLGLMVAAHETGDEVTWYVTPMEMGGSSFDEVPNDAAADARPEMLARARTALLTLYPSLPDAEGLRVGRYAGYRQDIGDMPGRRTCALLAGTSNVITALPSGLVGPWLNARDTIDLVRGLTEPIGAQPALPYGGDDVRVGSAVEDRPGFTWMSWHDWQNSLL